MLNGTFRRSYVLWQEFIAPLIVLEFVSGNGAEERDRTPWTHPSMGVELGIWQGHYLNLELPWLRW